MCMIKEDDGSKTIYIIMPFYKVKRQDFLRCMDGKLTFGTLERKYSGFN
jgi:hypothetical protein